MSRQPRPPSRPSGTLPDLDRLRDALGTLMDEAVTFVSLARITEQARSWMARGSQDDPLPGSEFLDPEDAMDLATDLALFTPATNGLTAFDRLARKRTAMGKAQAAALALVQRATPRLLRIEGGGRGSAILTDLLSDDTHHVLDDDITPEMAGTVLLARLAPIGDGRNLLVGAVTPLDQSGLAAARALTTPGQAAPLPLATLKALYRHVLRQGTPLIPGLNDGYPEEDSDAGDGSDPDA